MILARIFYESRFELNNPQRLAAQALDVQACRRTTRDHTAACPYGSVSESIAVWQEHPCGLLFSRRTVTLDPYFGLRGQFQSLDRGGIPGD